LTCATAIGLLCQAARRLAIPAILAAALVAAVHLAPHTIVTNPWRPLAFASWWLALALGAAQTCRTVAGLDPTTVRPPPPIRLRLGLWTLTTAAMTAGSAIVGYAVAGGHLDPLSVLVSTSMLLLASVLVATLRDLHDLRPLANTSPPSSRF
jgi:hypothetical protein